MKRLYVLFHGRYPSEKAAALFALESARAFIKAGYEVIVLAPRRRGAPRGGVHAIYLPTLDLFGLLPHALAFRLSFFAFSISAYFYLLFTAHRNAVIYSNEPLPLYLATFSFPHTIFELHDFPNRGRPLYRSLLKRVAGVLITNKIKAERAKRELALDPVKLLVEQNAVNVEQFSPSLSRGEARKRLGLPSDKHLVVYTGHLYVWKGVDTLARAVSFLSPNTYIYFVGGTQEDIARMQKEYPHTQNMFFKGNRPHDEIPLWQKAADVLVLPNTARERISVEDTSPMKLFEYMASGTPIVASRLPSIEEIADDSRALLVAPDDPHALAQGITDVLRHGGATRAEAARAWVFEHTWEKRARRIILWLTALPDEVLRFRHERILFYASVAVTSIFIVLFVVAHGRTAPLSLIPSDGYLPLATALYEHGVFTYSTTTPYILEAFHTPGYPFFLFLTAAPWGTMIPALLIQALMLAFAAIFLYRLFAGVFSPTSRFIAALVFGIEPFTAYIAAQPLSEIPFLFFFIAGLLAVRLSFERASVRWFFIAGLLLGAATLIRPIVLYLLPIVVLAVLLVLLRRASHILAPVIALFMGMSLLIAPWIHRNYIAFGIPTFTTKGAYTLYFYDVQELLAYKEGISNTIAHEKLLILAQTDHPEVSTDEQLRSPIYASYLIEKSKELIAASPLLFAKLYATSLVTFFLSDGYRLLWYESTRGAVALPNITRAIVTADLPAIEAYFKEYPGQAFAFLFGLVFWGGALLFAFVGAVAGLFSKESSTRYALLACIGVIVYFALLTGPVAQARYRIVVTPFLFMLAAYGAAYFFDHRRSRSQCTILA